METKLTEEEKSKKKKKNSEPYYVTRCTIPLCYEGLKIYDSLDPDVELAKHKFFKHSVPFPTWYKADDIKFNKPRKKNR